MGSKPSDKWQTLERLIVDDIVRGLSIERVAFSMGLTTQEVAAVSLGTAVMGTPVPTNSTYNTRTVRFRLELSTSWMGFFNLTDNVAFTASMAKTGPFNVGLRFKGTEATISDVRAGAYSER